MLLTSGPASTRSTYFRKPLSAATGTLRCTRAKASSAGPNDGRAREVDLKHGGRNPTDPQAWASIVAALKEAGTKMIAPQEVQFCAEKGMTVLDIRPNNEFEEGFIEGAVNAPLYQPIAGWDAYKVLRRATFGLFGISKATEPNPNFLEEVAEYADAESGIVIVCNLGGSIDPIPGMSPSSGAGQSRSIIAAFELMKAGYSNLHILRDGMRGWERDGRELFVMPTGSEAVSATSSDEE